MNFSIPALLIFAGIAAIFFIWQLLKPKKTERRRFSLRERRLRREEEKENEL